MATQDRSPSLIIGQQWSSLTDLMFSGAENDEESTNKDGNRCSSDTSMKLGRQDMSLFGFCPSRDEFSLVVCEKCNLLVKPQALKQHIESRHGPTNLSSLGSISASALNSELGKKLLMPLPIKPAPPPTTTNTSNEKQAGGSFKPLSLVRPPTKASLKQVPAAMKTNPVPIFGVGMKINITKPVKSGNRVTPTKTVSTAISNPVVKMEKLEKVPIVPLSSSSCKSAAKQLEPAQPSSELSKNILSLSTTKISTLVNGSIKSAISLITTSSASVTTSSSTVSNPMLIAVTKTSTDTPLSSRNVTTFVNTSPLTKPVMVAPIMTTIGPTSSVGLHPVLVSKTTKIPKDQKERKFLPCKDREYDANKHCGVLVSETGKSCTRSLTCKTHALSLRRAVSGRCKSFDALLKEHKATKEALLKAKAENQNAATSTSSKKILVSPATINSALNALKQQMTSVISQNDGKFGYSSNVLGNARPLLSPNVLPTTVATFVKPHSASEAFQRITSSGVLPPAITVKEEKSGTLQEASSRLSLLSPEPPHPRTPDSKLDHNFFSHHPRPLASNNFGGRLNDKDCLLFSRKMDYVRAALLSALERQLNPPPHKKLCVESNLPKESQVLCSSQDPYEFNLVDTSGGGSLSLSPTLVNSMKPTIKPKSKVPTSPVAATLTNCQSLNLCSGTVAASLSLTAAPLSTLCTTPIDATTLSSSGLSLNWPVKSWDSVTSCSSSATPILSSLPITNQGTRKRSGSSNGQFVTITSGNGGLPLSSAVSLCMTTTTTTTGQQSGLVGLITPVSLSTHQTGHLITIPNVGLANASLGQRNAPTLGPAKITTPTSAASSITAHKNNNTFKDFNLVLTGIDPTLVNGQYVNITGAQLTELAASQGQTLFLNSFTPGRPNCSPASDTNFGINLASSTSRPAKRSRSSASKSHQTLLSSESKISTSALEGYKLIPASNVITSGSLPPTAVLMDGGRLQDAMLTLAAGGTTPTLVAIASSSANTNSAMMTGNSTQVLCADAPCLVSSSPLVNGATQSTQDKSGSNSQRHHHSSSKSHHHHHHHHQHHSKTQHQQEIVLASVLQGAPTVAVPISSGSATLCSSQALFKPGGTLNLPAKNVGGKLTMQPVSLTFPINVSQAGLAALTSDKPQQHQQQHTLLVTTSSGATGDIDPASVLVTGKSDLHLQSQISKTSTSNLIS